MFGLGWLFGGSPEITAIEKEQKNFIFLVEDLCKYKILYIVYSQNKCHELPGFDPNDKSRQTIARLFEEMSEALKNDIRTMLAKEIEFANSIIVRKEFIFIKPLSLEISIYPLYYSALLVHDAISKYFLNYNLLDRLTEIVEQLNKVYIGWRVDYEMGELTLCEQASEVKRIAKESKHLRELIALREEIEAREEAEKRAAQKELEEAEPILEKVNEKRVLIKVR